MGHSETVARIRSFWDADAATYDQTFTHYPQSATEWAVWCAALERLLPPAPSRVLDVGAGTGFISLVAARLGHVVTAIDVSAQMLAQLVAKAEAGGLNVTAVNGAADDVPQDAFDVVTSRHLLWTLPEPAGALRRWRAAAPQGRLLLLEDLWGAGRSPADRLRARGRRWARRLRGAPSGHHAEYDPDIIAALPFSGGVSPEQLIELVSDAGWPVPRLHRLWDVEWILARRLVWPERLFGGNPLFAVSAG